MNSRQLQLAVLLSQERSFSQVAKQLNISQPALSKQIISLEQELGIELFDRTTSPITITPAGEYLVAKAKRLLNEENQILKTLERYKSGENGKLTIGISPFRSQYLMPDLIKALKERFPGLQIALSEFSSSILLKGILEGQYDFAIMNLPIDNPELEALPLEQDELVLAMPERMRSLLRCKNPETARQVTFADCADLPFIALSSGQEMRRLFENLCTLEDVYPQISVEVVGVTTAWMMVQSGIGAALLPKQYIQNTPAEHTALLALSQTTYTRQPAIITRRGQYISTYAEYAIDYLQRRANMSE